MEAVFPTETHRNFPVIFPPDPAGNEMESGRQKSDDFQTGNVLPDPDGNEMESYRQKPDDSQTGKVSPEKAGYDRFR
jgi:hypothetical protein